MLGRRFDRLHMLGIPPVPSILCLYLSQEVALLAVLAELPLVLYPSLVILNYYALVLSSFCGVYWSYLLLHFALLYFP